MPIREVEIQKICLKKVIAKVWSFVKQNSFKSMQIVLYYNLPKNILEVKSQCNASLYSVNEISRVSLELGYQILNNFFEILDIVSRKLSFVEQKGAQFVITDLRFPYYKLIFDPDDSLGIPGPSCKLENQI